MYAQYCVFRDVQSAGIKVMLDGQGADEMLGGYPEFSRALRLADTLRRGHWSRALALLRSDGTMGFSKLRSLTFMLRQLLPDLQGWPVERLLAAVIRPGWIDREWFDTAGVSHASILHDSASRSFRDGMEGQVFRFGLKSLLRYEDRNSMAFSVESRVPFLTPALAELVLSLPADFIVGPDGLTKRVFRQAMRGLVPDPILARKDKIGFETPEIDWLADLKDWCLDCVSTLGPDGPINLRQFREEFESVLAGRTPFRWHLWRVVNFAAWRHWVADANRRTITPFAVPNVIVPSEAVA